MSNFKIVFSDKAPLPVGPYSQAVWANDTLYLSGQIAINNLQQCVKTQTKIVCQNIINILQEAKLDVKNVVKTTCFLADMDSFNDFNAVYQEFFAHKPARSCVQAARLPKDALVEIEVIAVK